MAAVTPSNKNKDKLIMNTKWKEFYPEKKEFPMKGNVSSKKKLWNRPKILEVFFVKIELQSILPDVDLNLLPNCRDIDRHLSTEAN
jgi:hypothetical protein